MQQPLLRPQELDDIKAILASFDSDQPQKNALILSTENILKTNISKEDMMAVVEQNNAKLGDLENAEQEDVAKLKYLIGELEGKYK